jgi:DNA ligase-1
MIKPMLAHMYNPDKAIFPCYIQPKLDGVRCIITRQGAFSRTGKEFKNIEHIKSALEINFFDRFPDVILDGELYNHDLRDDFEKIISLVRKTKPTNEDRLEASRLTQFHCYDIIPQNENNTYEFRKGFLHWELPTIGDFRDDCIHLINTAYARNEKMAQLFHKKNLKAGYEGSIYRSIDGYYKGTRSWDLMKFKDFSDAEATIVGYELGKGKREGTLGKFIMMDDEGIEFGCPPGKGYNYENMTEMLNNIHYYIGKIATFTYFGRTKANSYRHPLFKALRNYE